MSAITHEEKMAAVLYCIFCQISTSGEVSKRILTEMERLCSSHKSPPRGPLLVSLAATKVRLDIIQDDAREQRDQIVQETSQWLVSTTPEPWWWKCLPKRWREKRRQYRLNGIRTCLMWEHARFYPGISFPILPLKD